MIPFVHDPAFPAPHAFLGRQGGVSTGIYQSLNMGLGTQDDPACVRENRRRALALFPHTTCLCTLRQEHRAHIIDADAHWQDGDRTKRPAADGLVSNDPKKLLGILTADCTPILFADAIAGVAGAAHAGWRGAYHGVAHAVVQAMITKGACPENITAIIGPCIQQKSYQVDQHFHATFMAHDAANERFFRPDGATHFHFDLPGYNVQRMTHLGLKKVILLEEDTYSQPEKYFSARRMQHKHEPDYGRQISLISAPKTGKERG